MNSGLVAKGSAPFPVRGGVGTSADERNRVKYFDSFQVLKHRAQRSVLLICLIRTSANRVNTEKEDSNMETTKLTKTQLETAASEKKAAPTKNTALAGAVTGENVHFQQTVQKTLDKGVADITKAAKTYPNNEPASQAGFVAEQDHMATFNGRKAFGRDSTRAVETKNGTHGDYKIVKGKKVLVEGEVKCYGTAEKTENALRGYDDQQRVVPADQLEEVVETAKRKALKNQGTRPDVAKEHGEVASNASDCITDGKTQSTPRTSKELKALAKKAGKGEVSHKDILPPLGESVKIAAKSGAKTGGILGGAIGGIASGIGNAKAYRNGEKTGEEAVIDTLAETAVSAGDGALKGAAGSVATAAAKHVAARTSSQLGKRILGGSAPAVVAIGALEVGKHAIDLSRGKIDTEEFSEKAATTVMVSGGAWAGAAAGAAMLSPLGPVGSLIGAIGGGIAGAMGMEAALGS